jgi:hypothetical protein
LHGVKVVGARKAAQQMVVDVHVGYENLRLAVRPRKSKDKIEKRTVQLVYNYRYC